MGMMIGIIVVLLVISFICILITGTAEKSDMKIHEAFDKLSFDYCGGNPVIISDCKVNIYWKGEEVKITYKSLAVNIEERISYEDLISFKGITQQEIKRNVTLGRVAMFGVLALAMKKEQQENKYYIVMKYKKNDEVIEIILGENALTLGIQNALTRAINNLEKKKIA